MRNVLWQDRQDAGVLPLPVTKPTTYVPVLEQLGQATVTLCVILHTSNFQQDRICNFRLCFGKLIDTLTRNSAQMVVERGDTYDIDRKNMRHPRRRPEFRWLVDVVAGFSRHNSVAIFSVADETPQS